MLNAIILCAGAGTRLKPLTDNCPKPMLDIGKGPLIEHTINLLRFNGITEIGINLFYLPFVITGYLGGGEKFGIRINYSFETELMGTAGALCNFRSFVNDTFIVIYGDVFTNLDFKKMINFHKKNRAIATIALYKVDNPEECGIVELKNTGEIARFIEKPKKEEVFTNLANAGIYILEKEILKYILEGPSDFGRDIFPAMLKKGIRIYGYPVDDYLIDIGAIEKYNKIKNDLKTGKVKF